MRLPVGRLWLLVHYSNIYICFFCRTGSQPGRPHRRRWRRRRRDSSQSRQDRQRPPRWLRRRRGCGQSRRGRHRQRRGWSESRRQVRRPLQEDHDRSTRLLQLVHQLSPEARLQGRLGQHCRQRDQSQPRLLSQRPSTTLGKNTSRLSPGWRSFLKLQLRKQEQQHQQQQRQKSPQPQQGWQQHLQQQREKPFLRWQYFYYVFCYFLGDAIGSTKIVFARFLTANTSGLIFRSHRSNLLCVVPKVAKVFILNVLPIIFCSH